MQAGRLSEAALDAVATRVVCLILASQQHADPHWQAGSSADAALLTENHAFALRAAVESAVLLKNERALLPLAARTTGTAGGVEETASRAAASGSIAGGSIAGGSIAVIGAMAKTPRYQGSGSSNINAFQVDEPLAAIRASVEEGFQPATLPELPMMAAACSRSPLRNPLSQVGAGRLRSHVHRRLRRPSRGGGRDGDRGGSRGGQGRVVGDRLRGLALDV